MASTFSYDDLEVIRNRTFDEIAVGDSVSIERTLTAADIQLFAAMSGDINPQHIDAEFAASTRFHGVIAHGMWGAALISAVLGTRLPVSGEATVPAPTERIERPRGTLPHVRIALAQGDDLVRVLHYVRPLGRIKMAVVHPCNVAAH